MRKLGIIFLVIIIVGARAPAAFADGAKAQEPEAPQEAETFNPAPEDILPVGPEPEEESLLVALTLSIDEVSRLALENSLDIQIAQYDAYMSRTSLEREESIFDTMLDAGVSYDRDKKESSSTLAGTDIRQTQYSLGLEKKFPTGTTASVDLDGKKYRSDSSFVSLNPYHEAEAGISLTQELGKNFFGLADRAKISVTKLDIENSDFTSLDDIENALADVQKAYWYLVLRYEIVSILEDMLEKAEKLFKAYQERYPLGLVEEADLLSVEALAKSRAADLAIAGLLRETAKNELLFLLNHGEFSQEIIPLDQLSMEMKSPDFYQVLRQAIKNRRDYKEAENNLAINKIELVVKKNALWPEIDLQATFSRNNLDATYGKAWGKLAGSSNDQAQLGISFKVPLENKEARANLSRERLKKEKLLLVLKRIERLILRQLNDDVSQVNTEQNQVLSYENIVEIHTKKLAEQIKRMLQGRSDTETLILYEEDLLNARRRLVEYRYSYRASVIDLEVAQNVLLDKYWEDPLGRQGYEDI